MTDSTSTVLPKRKLIHPILLTALIFLGIGLTAGAAVWWWKSNQGPVVLTTTEQTEIEERIEKAQYEPGVKTLVFSEREVNGLLNLHTNLGDDVKIELAEDALHARVKTLLDEDVPVLGGKTLKAKARFLVETNAEAPSLILDDLTVYGVSVPNAWLADLKGKNLLESLTGGGGENAFSRGIEEINIQDGSIEIKLAE